MKFKTESEVIVPGIGKVKHTHEMNFPDSENVFGRVLEYRKEMQRLFPGCKYELISAKRIDRN